MIEKMKAVTIVSKLSSRNEMLSSLRNLGVVHIKQKKHADPEISAKFAALSAVYGTLCEIEGASDSEPAMHHSSFAGYNRNVEKAIEDRKAGTDNAVRLSLQIERLRAWGDFSPAQINELKESGTELHFYRLGKKELSLLEKDSKVSYVRLSPVEKMETVAVIGSALDRNFPATEFDIPEKGLSELEKELEACRAEIDRCNEVLRQASRNLASYKAELLRLRNKMEFSSVELTSVSDDALVWLSGYVPESDCPRFMEEAKANSWAYAVDDIAEDDEFVPTKIRYSKVSRLMEPVFGILGTVPGYREYDISFWFLCFFSLFFAMIIGDAGYGFCFLAAGVLLHVKMKKVNNMVLLAYVVSIATIVWGALTGTWFGLEGAMKVPLLRKLVIPSFANYPQYFGYSAVEQQNVMMKFCFILGTIQLSLACIMNIRRKIGEKNISFIADIGWLTAVNALYYVVLLLVINEQSNLMMCAAAIGAGFVMVCMFGGFTPGVSFSKGLKASLANSFTNFLNTISAFGNIMSYIRLFAVGLASLAIAQSFNDMALGMTGFMKVFGILIFALGHVLNLVMGLLSVIVHGVRLNLLEFSGQLGMEWSGTAYDPFRISVK